MVMPLGEPLVNLGQHWLVGEAVAVVVSLIPAQLVARWTIDDTRLPGRAAMQAAAFSALLLWVITDVILRQTGSDWTHFLATWQAWGGLPIQLALVPALMGMSAVQEFAHRGGGTPIPFDPPRRLVTTGPYAYVANPMQLSMAMVLTIWGLIVGSWWVVLAGPMSVVYGCGIAASDEGATLGARFGAPWRSYRNHVRAWIPRLSPYHASADGAAPETPPARLYVAATCGPCSEIAAWFGARRPLGLELVAAELHPSRDLWRITYEPGDGSRDEEGVAAVARALEHVHLGWALIGWTMRLPLLRSVLQLLIDASGGEAKVIARVSTRPGTESMEVSSCPQ
jgi:protein-S-isoprenylcysteine O-methyltransferase Ste14